MRMSDIVASMGLTIFPIIGLAAFGSVFIAVSIRAMLTSKRSCEQWASLPLDSDDAVALPGTQEGN